MELTVPPRLNLKLIVILSALPPEGWYFRSAPHGPVREVPSKQRIDPMREWGQVQHDSILYFEGELEMKSSVYVLVFKTL